MLFDNTQRVRLPGTGSLARVLRVQRALLTGSPVRSTGAHAPDRYAPSRSGVYAKFHPCCVRLPGYVTLILWF